MAANIVRRRWRILRSRSRRSGGSRRRAALQLLLQTLNLLRELLIAVLQLLDLTSEVAQHALKAIKPRQKVGSVLRASRMRQQRTHDHDHKKRSSTDHSLRHFR